MALLGAAPVSAARDWVAKTAQVAATPGVQAAEAAQAATADRISFYNVPSDHKLELQLNYVDGRTETIKYPAASCASGTVITRQLNLYTVTFVAEGCGATVFQNLNLRWMGDCRFEFEHDPDVHIIARGPYGETVIGDSHYPAGTFQLTNLPANTTSLAATMTFTNAQGTVQTGNVEFAFNTPHPGCGQASTPMPTSTATPTAISTETATSTATPSATSIETATSTATATATSTETLTGTATSTATSTETPMDTTTSTATVETATPTNTATPTVTSTATPTIIPTALRSPAVLPPTGLDPVDEPKALSTLRVYIPLVAK